MLITCVPDFRGLCRHVGGRQRGPARPRPFELRRSSTTYSYAVCKYIALRRRPLDDVDAVRTEPASRPAGLKRSLPGRDNGELVPAGWKIRHPSAGCHEFWKSYVCMHNSLVGILEAQGPSLAVGEIPKSDDTHVILSMRTQGSPRQCDSELHDPTLSSLAMDKDDR